MNAVEAGHEGLIRLSIFLGLFVAFALLERWFPRRERRVDWRLRWLNNLSLSLINSLLLRVLVPFSGTAFALLAQQNGWGLLNLTDVSLVVELVAFLLVFDITIYFQHRLFHHVNALWVLHRVHHTDLDYDLTTGNRFHPLSIIISMLIKLLLVLVLGAPVFAILTAEVLLNATSMFNHSNLKLPTRFEKMLRLIVVTPDMHRIHHSVLDTEHSCNFGFNFSCWDRLFGTYLETASIPQEVMQIGINGFDAESSVRLDRLLMQPFTNKGGRGQI